MFQQERVCQVNLVPEQETGIIERGCNNPTKLVNFESTDVATVSLPLLELSIPSPSIGGNKKEGRSLGLSWSVTLKVLLPLLARIQHSASSFVLTREQV